MTKALNAFTKPVTVDPEFVKHLRKTDAGRRLGAKGTQPDPVTGKPKREPKSSKIPKAFRFN